MKRGEKKAVLLVGITFTAIVAITVYLEAQHQASQIVSTSTVSSEANSEQIRTSTTPVLIPKGMNPNELPDAESRGARMLALYCAQCHDLPTPAMHTANEWQEVVNRMKKIMLSRRGGMLSRLITPPEKDWEILNNYLATHAQIPLDANNTSDLNTASGKAFQETCSQCHGAPSPGSHTSNEWPRVVLRMKSHIIRAGKKLPSQNSLMQIIEYLQAHGKDA